MSRRFPQTIALAVVSCFVLSQPALVAASTRNQKSSSSKTTNSTAKTSPTFISEHPRKVTAEEHKAATTEKPIKKSHSYSKNRRSTTKVRKLVHNHALPGNQEDCDACHSNCLVTSLACIAISIATACPACGLICLAAQAACQTVCNSTTACKNLPLPVVNDN